MTARVSERVFVLFWVLSVLLLCLLATGESQLFLAAGAMSLLFASVLFLLLAPRRFSWSVSKLPFSLLIGAVMVGYVYLRSRSAWVLPEARFDLLLATTGFSVFLLTRVMIEIGGGRVAVVLSVLGLLVVINLGVGVYQMGLGSSDFFPIPGYSRVSYDSGRLGGFFNHPNQFGAFAGLLGTVAFVHVLMARTFRCREFVFLLVCLICAVGVLMSGSRALLVVGSVSVFFLIVLCAVAFVRLEGKMPGWMKYGLICLAIVVPITLALGIQWLGERRAEGIVGGMKERQLMREVSYEQFASAPFIGAGGGSYKDFSRRFRSSQWPPYLQDKDPSKAHSDWVQFLGEYGSVGGAIALAGLLVTFFAAWRVLRECMRDRQALVELRWWVALVAILLFLGIHSVIDFPLRSPAVLTLLALVMGIAVGLRSVRINPVSALKPHSLVLIVVGCMNTWVFVWGGGLIAAEQSSLRSGQPTLAIEKMQRAVALDPTNAGYYYRLGELWVGMGERFSSSVVQRSFFRKAEDAFRSACSLRQDDYAFLETLVVTLDRLGKYDEAEPLHIRARELAPRHRRAWVNYCLHQDAWARESEEVTRVSQALALMEETLSRFGNGDQRLVDALMRLRKDKADMERRLEAQ